MEDALKTFDKLIDEVARMATAGVLRATYDIDERMRGITNQVLVVDDRVAGVDDRVAIIGDRVTGVTQIISSQTEK